MCSDALRSSCGALPLLLHAAVLQAHTNAEGNRCAQNITAVQPCTIFVCKATLDVVEAVHTGQDAWLLFCG
jgi:hypothetical protein